MRKLKKKWLRANSPEARYVVLQSLMGHLLQSVLDEDLGILEAYQASLHFTDKSIKVQEDPRTEYSMSKTWFLQIVAQSLKNEDSVQTKVLFEWLGWNYEEALNPVRTDISTIETFVLNNMGYSWDKVQILLVSRSPIPIGSCWKNNKSGIEYDIVSHIGNRYEMVGKRTTLFRLEYDIKKLFTKVES